jgi:flagellar operon protein
MRITDSSFLPIEQLTEQYLNQTQTSPKTEKEDGTSFRDILNSKASAQSSEVRFSKHAAGRLADRNIELTEGQMERLNEGAVRAQQKGIKESLVLVDQLAFIVNIPNNTVVTAMNQQDTAENVFTNIDGAVIA